MILAVDIGNTNIVVGCIDSKQTYFIERLSTVRTKTELEYAVDLKTVLDLYHIKRIDIEGCIISSVVPQITNAVKLAAEKVLKKEYPEQILGKYKDEVNKMAVRTGDRKHYAQLISLLRQMRKIKGGAKLVEQISVEWKTKYKNRPAMMDELKKL